MTQIPPLFVGLCDDAAIFPPGNAPLAEAVPAHMAHTRSSYAALVGPLVVSAAALAELASLVEPYDGGVLPLAVTCSAPAAISGVVASAAAMLAVRLQALEVALPAQMAADNAVPAVDAALDEAFAGQPRPEVFVEVPRDGRRAALIEALAASPYCAKFRTGGVTAELYPDCAELAAAVRSCVDADLAFKATAGLHHAIRHTDGVTGFDEHGFANLLLATDGALQGADAAEVAGVLAERDGVSVAARLQELAPERVRAARAVFRSYGTCSIVDPRDDLAALGLIPRGLIS